MAGPGTALRTTGTLLLIASVLLVGAAMAVPWATSEETGEDRSYWVWGIKADIPRASGDPARVWFDGDLDDQVASLGTFRLALAIFALGMAGAVVAMLMTFGAYRQRRRGYRWAGLAGLAACGLLLAGLIVYLVAMSGHITEDPGLTVRAHPDDHANGPGLFMAGGAFLVLVIASVLLVLGGRGISEESRRLDEETEQAGA